MATKKKRDPVSAYLAKIGSKGGQAKVSKGFGSSTPAQRKENARKAAEARWGKKRKAPKAPPL